MATPYRPLITNASPLHTSTALSRWESIQEFEIQAFDEAIQVMKACTKQEEDVIMKVLEDLLSRKPDIDDFRKVARIFSRDFSWNPDNLFPSDFYTLTYDGVALGEVSRQYSIYKLEGVGRSWPRYSVMFKPKS
jgi:hypothetical protein